jgi:hypothetical protein
MLFGKLAKAIKKLFGLKEKPQTITYTLRPNASARSLCGSYVYEEPANSQNYNYPPSCHIIIPSKPGSQAIRKVSPKHFKPRTAHEKRLLKPKAKLEDEN